VFKIDGVHRNDKYQGVKNDRHRGKELFFCGLSFISQAHAQLGIDLVAVDSEAAGTMRILTDTFGFTFFNRSKELTWLKSRLIDYKELNAIPKTPKPRLMNSVNLLTKESIEKAVDAFIDKNINSIPIDDKFFRKSFNTQCLGIFKTTKELLAKINPTHVEFKKLENRYRTAYEKIYKLSNGGKPVLGTDMQWQWQVNALFDEEQNDQDTFLYLKQSDIFDEKMQAFRSNFIKQEKNDANDENINAVREVIIIDDDDEDDDDVVVMDDDDIVMEPEMLLDPDEKELIMYDKLADYYAKRDYQTKIDQVSKELQVHQQQVDICREMIREFNEKLSNINKKTYIF
jgi:hypothetical protein